MLNSTKVSKHVLLLVLSASLCASADYYPATSRFGYFEPGVLQGVVGGIPTRSGGSTINASDYGFSAVASAATNAAAIESAMLAASPGDVVLLPAGEFSVGQVDLNETHSGITLRGAGMGSTILNSSAQYGFVVGRSTNYGSAFNASSTITSMSAGSASITVSDGSGFASPTTEATYRLARIYLTNETSTPIVSVYGYAAVRSITVVIKARSGNTLTLAQPLPSSFTAGSSGASIECAEQNALNWFTYGVGLEDFTLDGNDSGGTTDYGILFTMASQCWLKGVKIQGHDNYGAWFVDTSNCEIRKSYIGAAVGGGSNRSGLLWNSSTYGLVEDNIIVSNTPQIEINFGSTSNVFAYNYLDTGVLNTNHGPHNSFNLFEGNSYWYAQSDGYFGGSSEETHFRNWMRSGVTLSLKRFTRNPNVVGNIVGTVGGSYPSDYSSEWGLPNINNTNFNGTAEPSTTDWWSDWNTGVSGPRSWTGTLTTRTGDSSGVITLGTGQGTSLQTHITQSEGSGASGQTGIFWTGATQPIGFADGTVSSDSYTITYANVPLPAQGTDVTIWPSPDGFQEKDLDVANTAIRKANYYIYTGNIPAGEALGGDTLPNSYYHTSKPSWFGNLAWPAYDPSNPPASEAAAKVAIPAGYRYVNGNEDYLGGGSASTTISGTLTVTGTITLP